VSRTLTLQPPGGLSKAPSCQSATEAPSAENPLMRNVFR
jgi:hypothetical protein